MIPALQGGKTLPPSYEGGKFFTSLCIYLHPLFILHLRDVIFLEGRNKNITSLWDVIKKYRPSGTL